ncbi:lipocalin-like domain-containing protein [Shewanella waksmanii]|uniref:lipocalin-like domain-containing protein n=1 Tax=Shewanella waksmanii TaxID=213783 RepID=UPI00373527E7
MKPYLMLAMIIILTWLQGCSEAPNEAAPSMGNLMGVTQSGYAEVLPTTRLNFPADHQSHDDFRLEWWYLTANLTTENGRDIGVQWTQFRIALAPPLETMPSAQKNPLTQSTWNTRQLFMAHSALTSQDTHSASERWSRAHPKLANVTPSPFSVTLDNWRWQSSSQELFPAQLSVSDKQFNYQLNLTTQSPYQLQGEQGYSIKDPTGEVASHYYSQPFIDVTGWVEVQGKNLAVSGQAWLDREWSSQFLKNNQQGWDWFALRLDDGSALMMFQLRGEPNFYTARRMFKDGSGRSIANDAIKMQPTAWQTIDNRRYPVQWQVSIAQEQIDLNITPLNPNALQPLSVNYWEGPINATGSHQAKGYMELTGY